jgi:1-acyl-sn-glycerol-3-phosphate acyltransferase
VKPERAARTVVALTVTGIDTLAMATTSIAGGALLGPTHPFVSGVYRAFARVALLGFGARVCSNGDAHLDPRERFVFASNHQSHLDALAILVALKRHAVRFVAKEELARVPLFGQALRLTGNVFVDRGDTRHDVSALDAAQRELLERVSVLFFPEGTRSHDGALGPFKKGAAVFAIKAGVPLVPVGVHGSFSIYPRGFQVHGGGRVGVSIGSPLAAPSRDLEDRERLTEELRSAVVREMARARQLTREEDAGGTADPHSA